MSRTTALFVLLLVAWNVATHLWADEAANGLAPLPPAVNESPAEKEIEAALRRPVVLDIKELLLADACDKIAKQPNALPAATTWQLIVSQTPDVHRQLAELIPTLTGRTSFGTGMGTSFGVIETVPPIPPDSKNGSAGPNVKQTQSPR